MAVSAEVSVEGVSFTAACIWDFSTNSNAAKCETSPSGHTPEFLTFSTGTAYETIVSVPSEVSIFGTGTLTWNNGLPAGNPVIVPGAGKDGADAIVWLDTSANGELHHHSGDMSDDPTSLGTFPLASETPIAVIPPNARDQRPTVVLFAADSSAPDGVGLVNLPRYDGGSTQLAGSDTIYLGPQPLNIVPEQFQVE